MRRIMGLPRERCASSSHWLMSALLGPAPLWQPGVQQGDGTDPQSDHVGLLSRAAHLPAIAPSMVRKKVEELKRFFVCLFY